MQTNGNDSPSSLLEKPAAPLRAVRAKTAYPLASLALLITALACLLACVDVEQLRAHLAWVAENGWIEAVPFVTFAAIFGGVVGIIYLFASGFSWRKCLVAPLAGILAGELGLMILAAPGPMWRTIFAIGILLVSAVIFRLGAE